MSLEHFSARQRRVATGQLPWEDTPIWGAAAIAEVANIRDKKGNLDLPATFYKLQNKHLDASKVGGEWCSTPRRIIASLSK
jgi:hypothetical protein